MGMFVSDGDVHVWWGCSCMRRMCVSDGDVHVWGRCLCLMGMFMSAVACYLTAANFVFINPSQVLTHRPQNSASCSLYEKQEQCISMMIVCSGDRTHVFYRPPPHQHVLLVSLQANLNDSHNQMVVHWAGEKSNVIVALARDSVGAIDPKPSSVSS